MVKHTCKYLKRMCLTRTNVLEQFGQCYSHETKKPYFITTPIFYVNNTPHLGHLYTVVLADTAQRFQKLLYPLSKNSILFTTGTDEHGLKIHRAASLARKSPLDFCTNVSLSFKNLFDKALIQYSDFIRTTELRHKNTVEHFFNVLHTKGYIYKGHYEGWYCVSDECFLTEKQVKKTIMSDGSITHTSEESGHPVEWNNEDNYIFKMSLFKDDLLYWLKEDRIIPSRFQEELRQFILQGVHDLSISRPNNRVSWGIPLPCDFDHTIYVWFDALVNYLTAVGYPNCSHWPPNLQIIGKDILRFHGIYWPALLMAAGLDPPEKLVVHSHWKHDGTKMSKSKGNIICPSNLFNKYTIDGVRYLLLRKGTLHADASWNDVKAVEYLNAELANTFGNLLNRCTSDSLNPKKIFPIVDEEFILSSSTVCKDLLEQIKTLPESVKSHYFNFYFYLGIEEVMRMLRTANLFIEDEKPWKYREFSNRSHLDSILSIGLTAAKIAAICLQPIIPVISNNLLNYLAIPSSERTWSNLKSPFVKSESIQLGKKLILFKRIE